MAQAKREAVVVADGEPSQKKAKKDKTDKKKEKKDKKNKKDKKDKIKEKGEDNQSTTKVTEDSGQKAGGVDGNALNVNLEPGQAKGPLAKKAVDALFSDDELEVDISSGRPRSPQLAAEFPAMPGTPLAVHLPTKDEPPVVAVTEQAPEASRPPTAAFAAEAAPVSVRFAAPASVQPAGDGSLGAPLGRESDGKQDSDDDCEATLSADAPIVRLGNAAPSTARSLAAPPDVSGLFDGGAMEPVVEEEPALTKWALSGGDDGSIRLWSLQDFSCWEVLEGHVGAVHALAADFDEMFAISGAADGCRRWDLRSGTGREISLPGTQGGCTALAAQDLRAGEVLSGWGDGSLHLWDAASGVIKATVSDAHPSGVWALDVCWERRRAASGGDVSFKLWSMEDWTCLKRLDGHPGGIMSLSVDWAAAEPYRALIAAGSLGDDPRNFKVWDVKSGKSEQMLGAKDAVSSVCASWSRKAAVTGSWDGNIRSYALNERCANRTLRCDFGRVRSLAVDFEAMLALCGSSAGHLHLMDLKSGKEDRRLEGHVGAVTALTACFDSPVA